MVGAATCKCKLPTAARVFQKATSRPPLRRPNLSSRFPLERPSDQSARSGLCSLICVEAIVSQPLALCFAVLARKCTIRPAHFRPPHIPAFFAKGTFRSTPHLRFPTPREFSGGASAFPRFNRPRDLCEIDFPARSCLRRWATEDVHYFSDNCAGRLKCEGGGYKAASMQDARWVRAPRGRAGNWSRKPARGGK